MTGRGLSRQELIRRRRQSDLVGRQGEQATFREALQQPTEEATQFLFHIHGPAGVGKSTLIRQLQALARESQALTAYIDESVTDAVEAMAAISSQLAAQGVELKAFDKMLSTYQQRRHEANSSASPIRDSNESTETLQGTDQPSPSPSSVIGSQIALVGLGMIPGVGAFTGALDPNQVAAGADRFKALLSARLRSPEDVELVLTPLPALTPAFLRGLAEAANRRPWVVLFFDTYERTGPVLDTWLRDIMVSERYGQLPANVLVVLAGQSKLNPQCWGDWLDLVTDLPLEVFTEGEARQLLAKKGITSEPVIEMILELSGRLPVLVSTLAEAHPSSVAEVGDPSDTAVERFLKWETNPGRRAAALSCALPQEIDEDIFRTIVPREVKEDFAWLRAMPFFINRSGRGHYHDVVRSSMLRLQRQQSPRRWREQHNHLADVFRQRCTQLEVDAGSAEDVWEDDQWRHFRLQETYHRLCSDHRAALPHALRELLDAYDHDISTMRRWAQMFSQAGQDADASVVRNWGQDLVAALEGPRPGITALNLLLNGGNLDPSGKSLAHILRGWEHRRARDYEQAVADCSRSLELEPTARGYRNRGEAYRLGGQYEKALGDFTRAIELDPHVAWALESRGDTYQSLKKYDQALEDFERALTIEPDDRWLIARRGEVHRLAGQFDDALRELDRALELEPGFAWALASRGETYRQTQRHEDAIADFSRALEIDPDYAWALARRAEAHKSLKRYEESIADYSRAIEIEPRYAWAATGRADTFLEMGRHKEALDGLAKAIELSPEYIWAYEIRSQVYFELGRFEEAIADLSQAIEINPNIPRLLANRGYLYRLTGRLEEAIEDLDRALDIEPNLVWALANRGVTHRVAGICDKALTDLECAIALSPDNGWHHYEKAVVLHATQDPNLEACVSRVIELYSASGGEEGGESISDAGNLFLTYCLTSRWTEADRQLSTFLSMEPKHGYLREAVTVTETLRHLVSGSEDHLSSFLYRLEAALATHGKEDHSASG